MIHTQPMPEFATPIGPKTHGITGLYLWLVLDSRAVGATNNSKWTHAPSNVLWLSLDQTNEITLHPVFSVNKQKSIHLLIQKNKELINKYVSGTCCISDLLSSFIAAKNP
jgi:hypothetical protein